jgi:hypothetical protein
MVKLITNNNIDRCLVYLIMMICGEDYSRKYYLAKDRGPPLPACLLVGEKGNFFIIMVFSISSSDDILFFFYFF